MNFQLPATQVSPTVHARLKAMKWLWLALAMVPAGFVNAAQLTLQWQDNSYNEVEFKIERALAAGGPFTEIATAPRNSTSYIDLTVNAGTQYFYQVRASNSAGQSVYTSIANATAKLSQTITFGAQPGRTFGDAPFTVSATSSSLLPVSFSIVSGPATISGSTITLTGGGTVVVRASQLGDSTFAAAPNVDQSITVSPANQTITFGALAGKAFGDAPFTVSATASSGLPVAFTINSGPATISGNTVTITGAGTVVVRAAQGGNASYNAAPVVDQSFLVSPGNQTISFGALAGRTFGDAPFSVAATASSGLAVSFSIASGPATISGSTVTITGAGTIVVRASQAGNANYNAAPNVDQNVVVAPANQTITFGALAGRTFGDAPFTVSATASSGLAVTFSIFSGPATISGNTVTLTGAGNVVVRASQAGNTNYNAAANVDQTVVVARANQTITFGALPNRTTNDAPFNLTATSSSGLAVSFSIVSGPATLAGDTLTITGVGTVVVRAAQAGNGNYNAAATVDQSFNVAAGGTTPQTITFDPIVAKTFGDAPFNLTATSTSGLPVTLSVVSGPATISGNTVTITGAGTAVIRASQLGDSTFMPASNVDRNLVIAQAAQTITFGPLAAKLSTDAPFTVSATASSGLAVTFSIVSGPATVSGNTITLTGAGGTVVVRAAQAGNANYTAAANIDQSFVVSVPFTPPPPTPPPPAPIPPPALTTPPQITTQPVSQTVVAPNAASFSVVATGSNLTYNWKKDGVIIAGAGGTSYTISPTSLSSAGSYSVDVFNSGGLVSSSPATLTVETTPTISTQPAGRTVVAGSNVSFSVTATAIPAPTYQWRRNGVNLAGQTTSTLNLTGVALDAAGTYTVVVTNVHGSVTSSPAELLVNRVTVAGSYFGTFPDGGSWALHVRPDNTATYIAHLPGNSTAIVIELTIAPDGTFSISGNTIAAFPGVSPVSATTPPAAAAPVPFVLSGRIANGQLTGQVLDRPLTASADQGTGQSTAGFYRAPALLAGSGATYTIVGPSGKAVVITATATTVDGATGTLGANNQLNASTAGGAQISVTLVPETRAIAATYTPPASTTPITFSGVEDTVPVTSALANLSIRTTAGTGAQTLIVGFAIAGGTKPILVRGIGPGLAAFNVTGTLPDPRLELSQAGVAAPVGINDNWDAIAGAAFSQVGAFALQNGSRDAALLNTLTANSYTAQLTDVGGATGIALVELYDAGIGSGGKLVNVSARSQVGTGGAILIAGFNVSGVGPRTLLVRGIGPALTGFGVTGALADPRLDLFAAGNSTALASNDNWEAAAAASFGQVGAFNLTAASRDAVLLVTLNPGTYTAQVSGVGNTTGVALVEVYEVP